MTEEETKRHGLRWTDDERNKLIMYFEDGLEPTKIADLLGRTERAIYFQLDILGLIKFSDDEFQKNSEQDTPSFEPFQTTENDNLPLAGDIESQKQEWRDEEDDKLRISYNQGESVEKIAKTHNRSEKWVLRRLRKLNVISDVTYQQYFFTGDVLERHIEDIRFQANDGKKQTFFEPLDLSNEDLAPETLNHAGLISVRLMNVLKVNEIKDIRDAFYIHPRRLLRTPNFGRKTLKELQAFKASYFVERDTTAESFKTKTNKPQNELANKIDSATDELENITHIHEKIKKATNPQELRQLKNRLKEMKKSFRSIERAILEEENNLESQEEQFEWEYDGNTAQKILELLDEAITFSARSERDADVLRLRLGLSQDNPPLTLQEIGEIYGVTRERIRQIEKRAYKSLHWQMNRSQMMALSEIKKIGSQIFLQQTEEPLDLIIDFCWKYYGHTIQQQEVIIYIALCTGLFSSYKQAKPEVAKKYKEILEKARQETRELLKNKKALAEWSKIFGHVLYPDDIKSFEDQIDIVDQRLREPSKNSLGQTGAFFSKKCNRDILYESGEEYRLYQIMEKTDKITWYQEQPLAIPYKIEERNCLYYPDIAVLTDEGRGVVIEVKTPQYMILQSSLRKALAALDYLHQKGMGYIMVNARGHSLKTLGQKSVNSDITRKILQKIDDNRTLEYKEYKRIIQNENFKMVDFISLVVQNDLSFFRYPFRLSRLPKDLSFESLI